jgi:anti-sigma regulatory factor (Ser/Thr protein kinase)
MNESAVVERSLPAVPNSVPLARRAVNGIAGQVPSSVREDVALLVSELVTNSVRHGGLSPADRVRLRIDFSGRLIRAEVFDPGPGFPSGGHEPSLLSQSGWGLYLVGQLASRWGIESDGGTLVWFEIDCPPGS